MARAAKEEVTTLDPTRWEGIKRDMKFLLVCIAAAWLVQIVDWGLQGWLDQWMGIRPREVFGLQGIALAPWAHADFAHLSANTVPWLVLGALASAATPKSLAKMSLILIFLSGMAVWLVGRPGLTVGASGLVYAYFGYLLGTAWYGRQIRWILVAGAALLAGGLIDGLVPTQARVSWEGHLLGMVTGIWLASRHHKRRVEIVPPPVKS